MKHLLIKQAIFLPVIYFASIIIAAFFANEYSHIGQHASELGINANKTAVIIFQVGIILTSISLILLSLGLVVNFKKQFSLFAFLVFLFGVTFIFGAIFPIGSPWHGFYGLGLFIMIAPFVFLYELNRMIEKKSLHILSIVAGALIFLYLWAMVARLDPMEYRGLTQRLFALVVLGWFSIVAWHLNARLKRT
ncbi:DUF998 domain-containing protein [Salinivirga cyanobacteriivorans]